ncbi:MAG: gas vesicle protein [Actinomycetota bacterium]
MSTSNTPVSMSQSRNAAMEPQRDREGTLTHVIETLLDKGLVINADITVSVAGVELLGIRIRAALASFETAARYGLEFPAGTNQDTVAWQDSLEQKETCPQCGKRAAVHQLLNEFCPWCGWRSARVLEQDGQSSGDRGSVDETRGEDSGQVTGPDVEAAAVGTSSDREQ